MTDRYLAEFRFARPYPETLTEWHTVDAVVPMFISDVVALIAEHHEAHTNGRNWTGGLFRCTCLCADTGAWRDVTDEALDAFGRWHLDMYETWPWWIDPPARMG